MIPVTNFSVAVHRREPQTRAPTRPSALRSSGTVRARPQHPRRSAPTREGEYLIIASTANSTDTIFQVWGWDGEPEDEPVLLNASIPIVAEGVWDTITATPEPIRNGDEAEVLQDDSKTVWYGPGTKDAEKGLTAGLQKSLGRLVTVEIPAPGNARTRRTSSSGGNPNKGNFTLKWKPAPTLRATVHAPAPERRKRRLDARSPASLSKREYTFHGNPRPRARGTTASRRATKPAKADTRRNPKRDQGRPDRAAHADRAHRTREPDYAGNGGWYKDSVTVSFTVQRRPDPGRRQLPAAASNRRSLTSPEDVQHQRLARKVRHGGRQRRQRLGTKACLTVQVDATPPSLEITCPATAVPGESVSATVTASDA